MDWDFLEKISAIVLAVIFWLFKDVVPYLLARYHDYRSNAHNNALITDLNRQLCGSVIHFPCEMIEISVGYLIGQVIFLSKMASNTIDTIETLTQESLILLLEIRIFLCCLSVLIIYPFWVTLTDLFHAMVLDTGRSRKEHIIGIVLCFLLWIVTVLFVLFCLNISTVINN